MPEPPKLAEAANSNKGLGRPKGSKNKITLIKLMAEEAVRSRNLDKMLKVCEDIIEDALAGDVHCRKLVWQSVMSRSGIDQQTPGEGAPAIIIRTDAPLTVVEKAPSAPLEAEYVDVTPN